MLAERDVKLLDALKQAALLPPEDLSRAARASEQSGHLLETSLIELGLIEEDNLAAFIADWQKLPLFGPSDFTAELPLIDRFDPEYLKRMRVAPVQANSEGVVLAMVDPRNTDVRQSIAFHLGMNVRVGVATSRTIQTVLEASQADQSLEDEPDQAADADIERLRASANDGPVVQMISALIAEAVDQGASDIHFEALETRAQIRLRVDGQLRHLRYLSDNDRKSGVSRLKIMAGLNISERRRPQDGRIRTTVRGRSIDLRLSTLPTQYGESIVMRVLDQSRLVLDWKALGFDDDRIAELEALIHAPHGIFLVTGPTGSGKTTTLYTALSRINEDARKIITIEDPIEYSLTGINQVQVHPEIGFGFPQALRAVLRQDPDVVMIGEIRDAETAANAVRAALMGRLVLSTVHTNSAIGAIDRLVDLGVEPFLLGATLRGIMSQRLVRRLCKDCQGQQCEHCGESGYDGRVVVSELLRFDPAISDLISKGTRGAELSKIATKTGFLSLAEAASNLVQKGVTDRTEIARIADSLQR